MQMNCLIRIFVGLLPLSAGLVNLACSDLVLSRTLAQTTDRPRAGATFLIGQVRQDLPEFLIVGTDCTASASCYLSVYMDKKYFTKNNLKVLSQHLLTLNVKKSFLKVLFFDNRETANQYLAGVRNWGEIGRDTRAVYSYDVEGKLGEKKEILRLRVSSNKEKPMITVLSRSVMK